MEAIRNLSRIIVGIVFTFSGFVKSVDPLGTTYKFQDYFEAFGMEWLSPMALLLSILLNGMEFIVGLCLFFNVRTPIATLGSLIFMLIFTPLTLFIAIENPVSDCGCFGDALVIDNWTTFYKNCFIVVLAFLIYAKRKDFYSLFAAKVENVIVGILVVFVFGFQLFNYSYLPVLDFRPYKKGANMYLDMQVPYYKFIDATYTELEDSIPDAILEKLEQLKNKQFPTLPENESDSEASDKELYNAIVEAIGEADAQTYGVRIKNAAKVPQPEFETTIFYSKNDVVKGFGLDNLPDTSWIWKETKNIMISKGYEPPIHDFNIKTTGKFGETGFPEGEDITKEMLQRDYFFMLVAYDLKTADIEAFTELSEIVDYAKNQKIEFLCLTATSGDELEEFKIKNQTPMMFCNADKTMLKTIVRSNPGLVLIKKGVVIEKWHYNELPNLETIKTK